MRKSIKDNIRRKLLIHTMWLITIRAVHLTKLLSTEYYCQSKSQVTIPNGVICILVLAGSKTPLLSKPFSFLKYFPHFLTLLYGISSYRVLSEYDRGHC